MWLPWLTTRADGRRSRQRRRRGGREPVVAAARFGAGQLIALLASTLIVAGAMAARGLSARVASSAALAISVLLVVLTMWYYRLYVYSPVSAGYGFYIGAVVTRSSRSCLSVWAMVAAWSAVRQAIMSGFVEPVSLTGERWVSLEPLSREHVPEIAAAAADGELGRLWFTGAPSPQTAVAVGGHATGGLQKPDTGLTFVVRRLDGTLIGSSSYLNVDAPNRRLEIGNTWYVASARRSGVNTETKLLMLGHAFE